eukprot:m.301272 g.301272  ORF g.301272 m.301272 type:complete len:72 (-) comp14700_c0_seq1:320-535(-)
MSQGAWDFLRDPRKARVVGVWLLGSSCINLFIAYQMLGERGRVNRDRLAVFLDMERPSDREAAKTTQRPES